MSRTFFFQQNDTNINDFDEVVLILQPFSWGNIIFKICSFCIKSHVSGREEFLWVAPPECNAAKLRNECFSLFMLASLYRARADTLPGESKQWTIFRYVNCDFWDRRANLGNYIASEKRIEIPSSKLAILVSSCWENIYIRNNQ